MTITLWTAEFVTQDMRGARGSVELEKGAAAFVGRLVTAGGTTVYEMAFPLGARSRRQMFLRARGCVKRAAARREWVFVREQETGFAPQEVKP